MADLAVQGGYGDAVVGFVVGDTTNCKIVVDVQPPKVMTAITGENPLPWSNSANEASVRQRPLVGGFRALSDAAAVATNSSGNNAVVNLWRGVLSSTIATNTSTITGGNVVTRLDGGNFQTESWKTGDNCIIFNSSFSTVDGVVAGSLPPQNVVTTVTSNTLTVAGAPWANVTLAVNTRLFRCALHRSVNVPANSGLGGGNIASVALFGGTNDPAVSANPNAGLQFGPNGALIAGLNFTLAGATGNTAAITVPYAVY